LRASRKISPDSRTSLIDDNFGGAASEPSSTAIT
jgi:hypothetical protein